MTRSRNTSGRACLEAFEARLFLSAGDLDPTFGSGGKVLTPALGVPFTGGGISAVLQAGNKAVVLTGEGLRRYNADGSPDTSFGIAGFVPITTGDYYPSLLALRPDNSIIVVGNSFTSSPEGGSEFVFAHFSANGTPDLAFGGGASNVVVNPTFGGVATDREVITRVLVQPDNKIVVAGMASDANNADNFAIARYNADGSPDYSFGHYELSTTVVDFGGYDDVADLALLPDGGILAVGGTYSSSSHHPVPSGDFAFVRLDASGAPDPTFGNRNGYGDAYDNFGAYPTQNPLAESPNRATDRATSVVVLPDGRFVVAGISYNAADNDYYHVAVGRYLPNGLVDPTFSPGGSDPDAANPAATGGPGHLLLVDSSAPQWPETPILVRQADGKLILGSTAIVGGDVRFTLINRLTADGAWDPPFGHSDDISDTAVDTAFGDTDYLATLLMTSDNRLLAVGSSITSSVGSIAMARYLLAQTPFGGVPVTLPGTIEAENYDLGGEGLAYHDLTPANEGGAYRTVEAVDIQAAGGASNGNVPAFARASEWTEYTVNVAKAVTADVAFRYAALRGGGKFHLEVDGRAVTPTLTAAETGSWQAYRTDTVRGVALPAGTHVLRLAMDQNGPTGFVANFDTLRFTAVTPTGPTPFHGVPFAVGETIQAEDYDSGGEGVAYHDTDVSDLGGANYRPGDGVDVQASTDGGAGFNVGFTRAGEYLVYTVNTPRDGLYDLDVRYAALRGGGQFHVEVDGQSLYTVSPPATGGWQTYRTYDLSGIRIAAGTHLLKLVMDRNDGTGYVANFNWLRLRGSATADQQPFGGAPAAVPGTLQAENFDRGGEGVAYHDADPANLGGAYRPTEAVDLQPTTDVGGGFAVGFIKSGEYLEYTVNTGAGGRFDVDARVASLGRGGTFHLEQDGFAVTGQIAVPDTGGWQNWRTVTVRGVTLGGASRSVLRVVFDTPGATLGYVGNLNWIAFRTAAAT